MPRIYTLSDISEGNKLGGIPSSRYPPNRIELENQLACANRDRKIAIECGNQLVNKCSVLDKDNKRIQRDLKQSNKDKEELSKHIYQLIEEVKRLSSELDSLISKITRKDISLNESKIKIKDLQSRIKILETELSSTQNESKKIKSLESVINILKSKLSSAQKDVISIQNDSSKKETEIMSLKSKIAEVEHELASKVSELEYLKSEAISNPVLGGDDEKNTLCEEQSSITKSDDISAISEPIKNLSQYFIRKKNMDQAGKIDGNISDHTRHDGITEPSKVDTEISSKINEETNINEISKDILLVQEIKNVTPHLAQPENNVSSLIESNSQIPIGGIGTIPIVASALMSPLSAYICLILLIIAVMWHDGITEPSKVDTEISSKINEETNINEISKDILLVQEIKNVTPHLAQPENNVSSLIESNSQIPIGGIGTIPIVASALMSPLSAYICLILLIIAVMWFVVLRRTWGFERKSDRLRDMWARY
ncbi:8525_t:CDS:2 [Entrophospora sp. SA101]|nr:8525_t:CDS:2 [Entrophospora sp. SA101]